MRRPSLCRLAADLPYTSSFSFRLSPPAVTDAPHRLAGTEQQPAATTGVMHRQQLFHRSRATTTGGISSGAAHVAEKTWMKEMVPKEAIPSHTLGTVYIRGITFPLI
uniref:Uncharacterized protein n=1 Tax=Oryza rufipogon TaxID=4529 RepID=A0A679BCK7_ORYRU|nr:hypothetical protein [Oryza rufipogon]BBF90154.1 hypothetical protein [Oryza rufipogon]